MNYPSFTLCGFQGARISRVHTHVVAFDLSKLNSVLARRYPLRDRTRRERGLFVHGPLARPATDLGVGPRGPRHGPGPSGSLLLRKEVIQPHLPIRLPCYDFTPITDPTLDGCLPCGLAPPASGVVDSRGVTGGVYKPRERIHRGVADPRLLAIPASCRRVAACNPNWDLISGIRFTSRCRCPLFRPL